MTASCICPACPRPTDQGICGRCWKLVSPELKLAVSDHHRIAEGRVTGELLSWLANPYEDGRPFTLWSWRRTLALAAWEAAVERSERRSPAYEPWTAVRPANEATLDFIVRKLP